MEADQERSDAHQSLTIQEAKALLGTDVVALDPIAEGKVNTNFRAETAEGPLFLRLHHGADHVVDTEAALAERLRGIVPIPRLLDRGPRWLVYEWLPGVSLERARRERRSLPYTKIASQLADARNALDTVAFPHFGTLNLDLSANHHWNSAAGAFFDILRMRLYPPTIDHAFAARMEEIADLAEPRLRAIEGTPVLVHSDFKLTNILVDEEGLVGIVDWEFAHAGTRLWDVGQLIRQPKRLPAGFASAFGDGLGLDQDDLLLARTLDLVSLVDLRSGFINRNEGAQRFVERLAYRVCREYEVRFGLESG